MQHEYLKTVSTLSTETRQKNFTQRNQTRPNAAIIRYNGEPYLCSLLRNRVCWLTQAQNLLSFCTYHVKGSISQIPFFRIIEYIGILSRIFGDIRLDYKGDYSRIFAAAAHLQVG